MGKRCGLAWFGSKFRTFDHLPRLSRTPSQQQIQACGHVSHLLHDVLYTDKRVHAAASPNPNIDMKVRLTLFVLIFERGRISEYVGGGVVMENEKAAPFADI